MGHDLVIACHSNRTIGRWAIAAGDAHPPIGKERRSNQQVFGDTSEAIILWATRRPWICSLRCSLRVLYDHGIMIMQCQSQELLRILAFRLAGVDVDRNT